ncbi:MAG: hypothetical protein HZB80_01770 [Deltaproteobacteria bacterium]|nr:hypothetical protein [Deltaproteobacteria bacterium]
MQINVSIKEVVINSGIPLKKRGKNHIGLCPFHSEKTPSFTVSEEKQIFRCFGCGEGGDAISFLMKLHKITFREAMKWLGHNTFTFVERKPDMKKVMFEAWKKSYLNKICFLIRGINRLLVSGFFKGRWQVERSAVLFHALPVLEYHHEILCGSDEDLQKELYRETGGC